MPAHGVGLCDEYHCIRYPEDAESYNCEGKLLLAIIMSVEAHMGTEGGREGVKLEDMILITQSGNERLTHCPHDMRLRG